MSKKIRKAIIPAAGLGTRFLPATKAQPKEMLPIVDKPTIQYIIEEAVASGIEEILIITGRSKKCIEDHFDKSVELELELEKSGKEEMLKMVRDISDMVDIHFIRQKEPKGLGHAISCAKTFVGNEPFAVLLGDDIVYNEGKPCLKQLIDCYDEYPTDVSDEVNAKLKEMYDKCRCTEDILVDVIRLLYPEDTFKTGTIRGYSQGDWQDYIVMGDVDTDLLEAMYFGKISDITVTTDEEEFGDVITHDELWRAEREEGLKEFFRNHYELDKNEEIHILQADGYKQVVDWKAVG